VNRILIVEDDSALSNGISIGLRSASTEIEQAKSLREAREKIRADNLDLIILDINLPDGNGLDLLTEVKRESGTKVIVLTANDMETDVVTGLELGADDYIVKPFSLAILRARVNTQFRAAARDGGTAETGEAAADGVLQSCLRGSDSGEIIETGGFTFDFGRMEFRSGDIKIELSKTEQKLLRCLLENREHTVTRDTLVDHIWTDGAEYVDENALSVTVKRLRDKLEEDPSKPRYIKTVYGLGYTWAVE
jgi:Response regulators consisting of a CheY-like receiver domain and a winged-helix DNA-binding domain